jgi:hypothetical protein
MQGQPVARRCRAWLNMLFTCGDSGWAWHCVASCRALLAPSLAPRDSVNVRNSSNRRGNTPLLWDGPTGQRTLPVESADVVPEPWHPCQQAFILKQLERFRHSLPGYPIVLAQRRDARHRLTRPPTALRQSQTDVCGYPHVRPGVGRLSVSRHISRLPDHGRSPTCSIVSTRQWSSSLVP